MKYTLKTMYGLLLLLITLMASASNLRAAERDIDGHTINTVAIGGHLWMQENLDVSRYRNGDPVRYAASNEEWLDAAAKGEGAWCYYQNDSARNGKYGHLYNWYAVHDPRGLAPSGWHVSSDEEWNTLTKALGGATVAGGKIKSTVPSFWFAPNVGADNSTHFSALPGGLRGTGAGFCFMGESAYFWSSSESTPTISWYSVLNYHNASVIRATEHNADGMSVRCVKD